MPTVKITAKYNHAARGGNYREGIKYSVKSAANAIGTAAQKAGHVLYVGFTTSNGWEGGDMGIVPFDRGMTILAATVTLETGGLALEAGAAAEGISWFATRLSMVNATDDIRAFFCPDGNSVLKAITSGNTQRNIGLVKTAATLFDFGINGVAGFKDGVKGMDVFSAFGGFSDLTTGLLPSAKSTINDGKGAYRDMKSIFVRYINK